MVDATELFEIIHTTRAMRRLKPDPVPDALINRILEAGQCAPNGANAQQWRFLVVKDRTIKQAVQVWYQRAFDEVIGPHYRSSAPPPGMDPERYRRQAAAVQYLTAHFHEAPVWIVACLEHGTHPTNRWSGASSLSGGAKHAACCARARSRCHAHDAPSRLQRRRLRPRSGYRLAFIPMPLFPSVIR